MAQVHNRKTLKKLTGNSGYQLMLAAKLFEKNLHQSIRAAIPDEDNFPYLSLFPHIDLEGTRITEIAKRMGVSKQAASKLIAQAEARGQLELFPDTADGRAKIVKFSQQGLALFAIGDRLLTETQLTLINSLGERKTRQLDRLLDQVINLLGKGNTDD